MLIANTTDPSINSSYIFETPGEPEAFSLPVGNSCLCELPQGVWQVAFSSLSKTNARCNERALTVPNVINNARSHADERMDGFSHSTKTACIRTQGKRGGGVWRRSANSWESGVRSDLFTFIENRESSSPIGHGPFSRAVLHARAAIRSADAQSKKIAAFHRSPAAGGNTVRGCSCLAHAYSSKFRRSSTPSAVRWRRVGGDLLLRRGIDRKGSSTNKKNYFSA